MQQAPDLLARYALYHRDERNIATHLVGVPMIVFALGAFLSRPSLPVGDWTLTPAWIGWALAVCWYLSRAGLVLGVIVSAAAGALFLAGHHAGANSMAWGVGAFVVGWALQFLGHWYEGRKPAFVDDVMGLLVGPMFVAAEALFAVGWNKPLQAEIERRVGPRYLRDMAHTV